MRPSERLLILSTVAFVFTATVLSQSLPQSLRNHVAVAISVQLNSSFNVPFTGRMPFTFTLHIDCDKETSFTLSSGFCNLRVDLFPELSVLKMTATHNSSSKPESTFCGKNPKVNCTVKSWLSKDAVTFEDPKGAMQVLRVPCDWKPDNAPLMLNIDSSPEMKSCKTAYLEVDGSLWQLYEPLALPTTTTNTSSWSTTIWPCTNDTRRTRAPETEYVVFAGIAWWGWLIIGATGTLVIVLLVAIVAMVAVCSSGRRKKTSTQKQEESEEDTKEIVTIVSSKKKPPSEAKATTSVDTSKSKQSVVQPKLESKEPSAPPPHPAMQSTDKSIQAVPSTAVEQRTKKDIEKVEKAPPAPTPRKLQMTLERPRNGDDKQGEIDTLEDPILNRWNSSEESATQKKFSKRSPEDLHPGRSKDKGQPPRNQDEVRTRDTQISSGIKPPTLDTTPPDVKNW